MRNGRRTGSVIDDDVRSSLDLLDGVIGEFDDGLTSSAESEAGRSRGGQRGHPPQPRGQQRRASEDKVRPELRGSHLSINDQIDDIFSQLTEEIYEDEKTVKAKNIRLSRSPTRNRFDPLPPPPTSNSLSSSARAPPVIDRKSKPGPSPARNSSASKYGAGHRVTANKTLTNEKPRSKSAGVRKGDRQNFSLPHDKAKHGNGEVILYEDHVVSNTIEKVVADVHKSSDYAKRSNTGPVLPEKQKIHLKHSSIDRSRKTSKSFLERQKSLSSQEAAVMEELKAAVTDKQGKISKFDNNKSSGQRGRGDVRSNLRDKEGNLRPAAAAAKRSQVQGNSRFSSPHSNSSQKSQKSANARDGVTDTSRSHGPGAAERRISHHRQDDYRRSRSMGPLENRDKSYLRQRSRSRGFHDPSPDRDKSRQRHPGDRGEDRQTQSKSRGQRHESFNSGSRGRAQVRGDRGRGQGMSPPSPAEAEEAIAALLPRYPQGLPPERQRSMIDLRVMEEVKKNQRRSMAVGPFEDLPPHLRNHLMPAAYRNPNAIRANIPQYLDEQLRFQHQMTIEAQREQLVGRGFPITHPLVSGEIPLHPELMGQLHFEMPTRSTLPLGPEDYRRFMPEMGRRGMQTAFPEAGERSGNRVGRAPSKRENSFVGLTGVSGVKNKKDKHENINNRTRSSDNHENNNNSKLFSWLNSGFGGKGGKEESGMRGQHLDHQWIMRERDDMKSMPPVHLSDNFDRDKSRGQQPGLDRDDKSRSSFGMILKDKFQKNPNMYFPDSKAPSKPSEFIDTRKGSRDKLGDSLSDTDTLIHNMSEGSFEKGSTLSGGQSIGSNKSSRSSGKSSSLSHDSMDGTPRMIRRSESITTPKNPVNTSFIIPTNPSVILNKKTIRNYVPPESNNMLRNLEDNRKSNQQQLVSDSREKTKASHKKEQKSERKSSVEKLIDDFHRNLPSPPPSKATDNHSSLPFSDGDSLFSGLTLEDEAKVKANNERNLPGMGTVTSQTSHWSVASSAASFDYHSVNSMENKARRGEAKRRMVEHQHSLALPSLDEMDVGERIPPEGAAAESPGNTVVVRNFIETNNNNNNNKVIKPKQVNNETSPTKAVVSDLMKASENDEDMSMLRKLISEGRISGLNEKPPPFIPPTPPSKMSPKRLTEGHAGSSKVNEEKTKPSPASVVTPTSQAKQKPGSKPEFSQATKSGDRPRKAREAPKPPVHPQQPREIQGSSSADIKFIAGRRIGSVESINEEREGAARQGAKRDTKAEGIKRSTSMHVPKDSREVQGQAEDAALAQLIADSTEKRFKINNIFKVKWKKKHYSFDLS